MMRRHADSVRERIKTTQLIECLQAYALDSDIPGKPGKKFQLSRDRIRAIEVLLRKSLPDLSNVTVSGDPENPLEKNLNVRWIE